MLRMKRMILFFGPLLFLAIQTSCFLLKTSGDVVSFNQIMLGSEAVLPEHAVTKKAFDATVDELTASIQEMKDQLYEFLPKYFYTHADILAPSSHLSTATFPPVAEGFKRFTFTSALTDNVNPALSSIVERTPTSATALVQRYPEGNMTTMYLAVVAIDISVSQKNTSFQIFEGTQNEANLIVYPYHALNPTPMVTCNEIGKSRVSHGWIRTEPTNSDVEVLGYSGDLHDVNSCNNFHVLLLNSDIVPKDPTVFQYGTTTGRTITFSPAFSSVPAVLVQDNDTNRSGAFCSLSTVSTTGASFVCRYRSVNSDSSNEKIRWFAFTSGSSVVEL